MGVMRIKMAAYLSESETNGPGRRSVLWVQGCPKRCPGCWNPSFLGLDGGRWVSVQEAFDLLTRSPLIEGVTFLGGEPFAQPGPLAELAGRVKAAGLSLMAYSGFTLEELRTRGQAALELLSHCDLLVDGEFVRDLSGPFLWRGSSNQKVHFLTPRYLSWEGRVDGSYRDFELLWEDGRLILTGDPPPEMVEVVRSLGRHGGVHG